MTGGWWDDGKSDSSAARLADNVAVRPRLRILVPFVAALGLVASTAGAGGTASAAPASTPSPLLRQQVKDLLQTAFSDGHFVGMSVAYVRPKSSGTTPKVEYLTLGTPVDGGSRPVTRQTQFEIGSESKTFTAGLLAALVAKGTVALSDPLQKYAPPGVTIPSWDKDGVNTPITLQDLATHQSGLPDLPENIDAGCPDQKPCAEAKQHYTEAMLWAGLQQQKLLWRPGTNWLYSNYAFGVLGTVLANVLYPAQEPPAYQRALDTTFLADLRMRSTELERPTSRLAVPYGSSNQTVPYWNNTNALAGGGGLISDVDDMETWVEAMLGYPQHSRAAGVTALPSALLPVSTITRMCSSAQTSSCGPARFTMGLAWQLYPAGDKGVGVPWAFKDGGTSGMHSVTALAPGAGAGVTVLTNGGSTAPDPLGAQILTLIVAAGPA